MLLCINKAKKLHLFGRICSVRNVVLIPTAHSFSYWDDSQRVWGAKHSQSVVCHFTMRWSQLMGQFPDHGNTKFPMPIILHIIHIPLHPWVCSLNIVSTVYFTSTKYFDFTASNPKALSTTGSRHQPRASHIFWFNINLYEAD